MPSGMPFSRWVGIGAGGATEVSECGMRSGVGDGCGRHPLIGIWRENQSRGGSTGSASPAAAAQVGCVRDDHRAPGRRNGMALRHPTGPEQTQKDLSVVADLRHRGRQDPPPPDARGRDGAARGLPGHPRRADARRQRAAEPRDVRHARGWSPRRQLLMAECFDKNMIDKDEYPQTAELEMRCVNMLEPTSGTHPTRARATGCSTTGSSEAACSAAWRSSAAGSTARKAAGKSTDKPNLVMGINVQICWEKFANYWDVELRLVPMDGDRFHLTRRRGRRSSATRTRSASWRSSARPSTAPTSPSRRSARRSTASSRRPGSTSRCTSTAPRARSSRRSSTPSWSGTSAWIACASINASGHKYGLVYPGVGWIVWRDATALPEDLIFWVNYLGDNMPTFALNFSRPGAQVVAQYYNFLRRLRLAQGDRRIVSCSRGYSLEVEPVKSASKPSSSSRTSPWPFESLLISCGSACRSWASCSTFQAQGRESTALQR